MEFEQLLKFTYYRGRVALYSLLKSLGVGSGDEVVTQAFTCLAVPEAILATGARPVYVDIEPYGVNIDPRSLQTRVTSKTKAIVIQHTFGVPAAMEDLIEVSKKNGVPIVEDCCHTLSTKLNGKKVGTFGIGAFYSYEWGKPVVVGVGGSAVINDLSLVDAINGAYSAFVCPNFKRALKIQVQYLMFSFLYRPSFYWTIRSAFHKLSALGAVEGNYNPVGMEGEAAKDFGLRMIPSLRRRLARKLQKYRTVERHSISIAKKYREGIQSRVVKHVDVPSGADVVYARYPLLATRKDELLRKAREANVELADWYSTPIHPLQEPEWHKVHYESGLCPNAERLSKHIVSLPTHERVSVSDVNRAIDFLNGVEL